LPFAPLLAAWILIDISCICHLARTWLDVEYALCHHIEGIYLFSGCSSRIFRIYAEAKPLFRPSKKAGTGSGGFYRGYDEITSLYPTRFSLSHLNNSSLL
jgi:hypothetical protein